MQDDIFAVVVTYNPDAAQFVESLKRLQGQVRRTVVVDNASACAVAPLIAASGNADIELLSLAENVGIGAGQNAGIEHAIQQGAAFILLLDQDSVLTPGMVCKLKTGYLAAAHSADPRPVAAVGPSCIDNKGYREFFIPSKGLWPRMWRPASAQGALPDHLETDFLVSSGSLIPVAVLQELGGMHADYFIDHLDREWCFRAVAAGYRICGLPKVVLEHQVGKPQVCSLCGITLRYRWQSPVRSYYMFRNIFLMLRDVRMPLRWKLYLLVRSTRYAVGACVVLENRCQRVRLILKGLIHGVLNIRGRYDTALRRCTALPASWLDKK